jgi:hypothetical protein
MLLGTLIGQLLTAALATGGLLIALGVLLSIYPIERLRRCAPKSRNLR